MAKKANDKRPLFGLNIPQRHRAPIKTAVAGVIVVGSYVAYNVIKDNLPFTVRQKVYVNPLKLSKVPKFYTIPEYPFIETRYERIDPVVIAVDMYNKMKGITSEATMVQYYKLIRDFYTYNDVRAIHNAFLAKAGENESLYDWIKSEDNTYVYEENLQKDALNKLNYAGVGVTNQLRIPTRDLLKI